MTEVLLFRDDRSAGGLVQGLGYAAMAGLFGVVPVAFLASSPTQPLEWVLTALLGAASLLSAAAALVALFGRERVEIENGVLRVVRGRGPLSRERSVPLKEITSVEVPFLGQEGVSTRWGVRPAVLVRSRRGNLLCGAAVSPREAETLAERIREAARA